MEDEFSEYSPIEEMIKCHKMLCESAQSVESSSSVNSERKKGLKSIIEILKEQHKSTDKSATTEELFFYGDTSASDVLDNTSSSPSSAKPSRKRRNDRLNINNNGPAIADYSILNNNNLVKNERLSPGTPDTSSRSRSVTPSPASHPDTPPAVENPMLPLSGRNYSDFMRSLAAKYNNANPNEYFGTSRNGFPPPLDPRFKPTFPSLLPTLATPKDDLKPQKPDFASVLGSYTNSSMFQPLIDMSTTQTLLAMVRTAKEAELQGLLKTKRQDASSPLDLSAAAPPTKRARTKAFVGSGGTVHVAKRDDSESPRLLEDVGGWSVEDVCNFIGGIDICAEYVQKFREHRIDGSGLPLLTEEHLTTTMNMKLGPALKLRSILAKKLGTCGVCLHCTHCHGTRSPEPGNHTGNSSDSGGGAS